MGKWLCWFGRHNWSFITASPVGDGSWNGRYIPLTSAFLRCVRCQHSKFVIVPGKWDGEVEKQDSELDTLRKMSGLK